MEEKKLTDEEIVEILKKRIENINPWETNALEYHKGLFDLIHRLQSENKELKSPKFASWKLKFFNLKEEFDKELSEHEEFTKKAKAEIERLTEENKKLVEEIDLEVDLQTKRKRQIIAESQEFIDEIANKNAELQKQVDELKAEKENLYFLNKNLEDYIDNHEPIWKRNTEQAVKDTAKEILHELLKWLNQSISFSNGKSLNGSVQYGAMNKAYHEVKRRVKKIAESKGVEVE